MGILKRIYWSDTTEPGLHYYDVETKTVNDFVINDLISPLGIAIDSNNKKVYWTDYGTHTVQRADLEGKQIEVLVENLSMPRHIALDHYNKKMYWTDSKANIVQSANMDGSEYKIIVKDYSLQNNIPGLFAFWFFKVKYIKISAIMISFNK